MRSQSQAHTDLVTAYGVIAGEASPPANDLTGQDLGGLTLTPGVYHFATSAVVDGNTHAQRPRQPERTLRFPDRYHADHRRATPPFSSSTAAKADNVYFQVGSSATLGTDTAFEGNILADQSVTLTTGASMLDGRALALVGAVTMDTNQISAAGGGRIGDEDDRGRPGTRGQHHRLHDHGRERRPQTTPRPWR